MDISMEMPAKLTLCIGQILISVISLILLSIGVHLLRHCSSAYSKHQKLYLTQLSLIEIFYIVVRNDIIPVLEAVAVIPEFIIYTRLAVECLIVAPWSLIMTLLTLDRLAEVALNIKYQQFITTKRTYIITSLCWMIGALLFVIMSVVRWRFHVNSTEIMHLYVLQILFIKLIVISIGTYTYIFLMIRKVKRQSCRGESSLKHVFVPLWIILTFLVFFELPNLILLFYIHIKHQMHDVMYFIAMVLIDFGCVLDMLIYVLMSKPLRDNFLLLIGFKR